MLDALTGAAHSPLESVSTFDYYRILTASELRRQLAKLGACFSMERSTSFRACCSRSAIDSSLHSSVGGPPVPAPVMSSVATALIGNETTFEESPPAYCLLQGKRTLMPRHPSKEIKKGTYIDILKKLGIKEQ